MEQFLSEKLNKGRESKSEQSCSSHICFPSTGLTANPATRLHGQPSLTRLRHRAPFLGFRLQLETKEYPVQLSVLWSHFHCLRQVSHGGVQLASLVVGLGPGVECFRARRGKAECFRGKLGCLCEVQLLPLAP